MAVGTGKHQSEQMSEQALVVYKLLHEQIAFLKRQQWTITNYVGVVYAAVFAVGKELGLSFSGLQCGLIVAAAGACIYALISLVVIQYDLGNARRRLSGTDRKVFGDKEYNELGLSNYDKPYGRGMFFTGALALVLFIGAAILITYLLFAKAAS
jgi:hypothetical protein